MIWIFLCVLLSGVASDWIIHKLELTPPWWMPEVVIITQQMPPDIPIELRDELIKMIENHESVEALDLSYQLETDDGFPPIRKNVTIDLMHPCPSSRLPEIRHRSEK